MAEFDADYLADVLANGGKVTDDDAGAGVAALERVAEALEGLRAEMRAGNERLAEALSGGIEKIAARGQNAEIDYVKLAAVVAGAVTNALPEPKGTTILDIHRGADGRMTSVTAQKN